MKVLQITDTHLYADPAGRLAGLVTHDSYSAVVERALQQGWPADLIVATGDIVHDGSATGYRRFKNSFEALGVRTLVIPGNHDKPDVLRRVLQGGLVTNSDHAVLGHWQFVMLDSTQPDSDGGYLDERQLQKLDHYLTSHPDKHALVCLHHHPVSMSCRWIDTIGVANGHEMFEVLDRHEHVRGVVWGHVHQEYSAVRNGVQLLACPSTCIQFRPREDDFALDDNPPGYRWMKLYDDGRIETGVERIAALPEDLDLQCGGYQ